jgi:hypothetical protein
VAPASPTPSRSCTRRRSPRCRSPTGPSASSVGGRRSAPARLPARRTSSSPTNRLLTSRAVIAPARRRFQSPEPSQLLRNRNHRP